MATMHGHVVRNDMSKVKGEAEGEAEGNAAAAADAPPVFEPPSDVDE